MDYLLRATLVWLTMVPVAIFNGAMRGFLMEGRLSELSAHIASTATGIVAMSIVSFLLIPFVKPINSHQAFAVGAFWVVVTVIFEFVFGRYTMGLPWQRLFHDYNLFAGRVWVVFLTAFFFMPYWMGKLRKLI